MPALVTDECALAVRAVGGVIATLAVVDQCTQVVQVVAVLGVGTRDELPRLSRRERRTFF